MATSQPTSRGIGVPTATALVTGTIIGSGIFTLPASLDALGSISMVGFAITTAGSMMLALVFAMMARRIPKAGGPYAYAREGFGDFIGFQTAWNYWIGAWVGVGAIAVSMVGYLGELIPALSENNVAQVVVAVGTIMLMVGINTRGVQAGGAVSFVLTVMKVVPLLLVGTVGYLYFDSGNLGEFNASDLTNAEAIRQAITITLFAFIGLESASIPAGDVHEPEKTIPRATIIGTGLAGFVYLTSTFALFGAVPQSELAGSEAPFSLAAASMWGEWAGTAMAAVAVVSCLGALNGLLLLSGQVPLAASDDGLAPRIFGKRNGVRAPVAGLLISGIMAALLTAVNFSGGDVVDVYLSLLLISTLATLIPYIFTAGAELKHLLLDPGKLDRGHLARSLAVCMLGLAYAIVAVMGAGETEVYWGFILVLLGVPIYLWILWSRARHLPAAEVAASEPANA